MMQSVRTIQINLKTPIWTGDISGRCNDLKETGLLGSIRWWFRLFLKSEGIDCCKKDDDGSKSSFDLNKYLKSVEKSDDFTGLSDDNFYNRVEAQLGALSCRCLDCLIFGTTGWKSQIGIRHNMQKCTDSLNFLNVNVLDSVPESKNPQNGWHGWRVQVVYSNSPLELEVIPYSIDGERYFKILTYILWQMSKYGALGAKPQNGFGIFEIELTEDMEKIIKEGQNHLQQLVKVWKKNKRIGERADQFRLYTFSLKEENLKYFTDTHLTITEDEEEKLRQEYCNTSKLVKAIIRSKFSSEEQKMFGKIRRGIVAGKILVSSIYKAENDAYKMRVWDFECNETSQRVKEIVQGIFANKAEEVLVESISSFSFLNDQVDSKPKKDCSLVT